MKKTIVFAALLLLAACAGNPGGQPIPAFNAVPCDAICLKAASGGANGGGNGGEAAASEGAAEGEGAATE